jgi:hypothetical protein
MTTGQFLALIIFLTTAAGVYLSWRAGKPALLTILVAVFGFGSAALSLYKDMQGSQMQQRQPGKMEEAAR